MSPLFSIILPTFNAGEKLRASIDSVLAQDFSTFECLAIDGASTDGTAALLAQYRDPRLTFLSEPDRGVYSGMNKGLGLARGRFLYFLGAGDLLERNILSEIAPLLPAPGRTLLYGNVRWKNSGMIYDGRFSRGKLRTKNICHQAIFYEATIFSALGNFDLAYPYCADWAFNMKCFGDRGVDCIFLDKVIAEYEGDGLSITKVDRAMIGDHPHLVWQHLGPLQYILLQSASRLKEWKMKILRQAGH